MYFYIFYPRDCYDELLTARIIHDDKTFLIRCAEKLRDCFKCFHKKHCIVYHTILDVIVKTLAALALIALLENLDCECCS